MPPKYAVNPRRQRPARLAAGTRIGNYVIAADNDQSAGRQQFEYNRNMYWWHHYKPRRPVGFEHNTNFTSRTIIEEAHGQHWPASYDVHDTAFEETHDYRPEVRRTRRQMPHPAPVVQ